MTHKNFVEEYRSGKLSVRVDRTNALRTLSAGYLPKNYYWAHTFWSWVWFISMPAGIILFFFNTWLGIGILILGFVIGQATKKSAMQFVLQHALDNEEFFKFAVESKTIVVGTA